MDSSPITGLPPILNPPTCCSSADATRGNDAVVVATVAMVLCKKERLSLLFTENAFADDKSMLKSVIE